MWYLYMRATRVHPCSLDVGTKNDAKEAEIP